MLQLMSMCLNQIVVTNVSELEDLDGIENETVIIQGQIDCQNATLSSISFKNVTIDGNNQKIINCIINAVGNEVDYKDDPIKVMGLFTSARNSVIKDLNITNCKYVLPYTDSEMWNGQISNQPTLFIGQILGYGDNVSFQNISINIKLADDTIDEYQNNTLAINETSMPKLFYQKTYFDPGVTEEQALAHLSWCFINEKDQFETDNITNLYFNVFSGIIVGYGNQIERIQFKSAVSYDFTYYDAGRNGEYCRYKSTQTNQDSSLMYGAIIAE